MSEKQFTHEVRTTEGTFIASFENETQATFDADTRNKRAEELGVKARYTASTITK